MALQISPDIQARIAEMVEERSTLADADAVLGEALALLEARERYLDLKRAIAQGVEEVAQGKVTEFTPEQREQLWQQALEETTATPVPSQHGGA